MGLSLSGPAALWRFKPLRSFSIPWAEIWILGIGGVGWAGMRDLFLSHVSPAGFSGQVA